jgi:hypothetical protein
MINTLTTARVLMVPRFAMIVTGQGLGSAARRRLAADEMSPETDNTAQSSPCHAPSPSLPVS